jgi:hypothetical protein
MPSILGCTLQVKPIGKVLAVAWQLQRVEIRGLAVHPTRIIGGPKIRREYAGSKSKVARSGKGALSYKRDDRDAM